VGIFLIATVGVCIKEYSKKKTLFVSEDDAITMVQESEMYGSMVAQYGPENVNITSHKLYTYDEYKEISHSFPYNYPPSGLKEGSSVWIIEVHITNREGLTAIIDSDTGKGNLIDREEGKTELLAK
jgi:hypothetical protein